jgi:hypothetical protein
MVVHLVLSQQGPIMATIGDGHHLVIGQREHGSERATATVAYAQHADVDPIAGRQLSAVTKS